MSEYSLRVSSKSDGRSISFSPYNEAGLEAHRTWLISRSTSEKSFGSMVPSSTGMIR